MNQTQDPDQKFFEAIKKAPSIFDQPEDKEGQKELLKIIEEKGEELGKGEMEKEPEDEKLKKEKIPVQRPV